jgi:predicted Kef-type K+ transport protein
LDLVSGFILGLSLSVASTVVLSKTLSDNNIFNTLQRHAAIGWLVVEDILTIFILDNIYTCHPTKYLPAILFNSNSTVVEIFKPIGTTPYSASAYYRF